MAPQEQQGQLQRKSFLKYWRERGFTEAWNRTWFGEKLGKFPQETRESKEEEAQVLREFKTEFILNQAMIGKLIEIEDKWGALEFDVFPYVGGKDLTNIKFGETPESQTITDLYRQIEYFRDLRVVLQEIRIFETRGTIEIKDRKFEIDNGQTRKNMEEVVNQLRAKDKLTEDEKKQLDAADSFLSDFDNKMLTITTLKDLEANEVTLPFLNGKSEKIIAFGKGNLPVVRASFEILKENINEFASSFGVNANVRQRIDELMDGVHNALEEIQKIESDHFTKLHHKVLPALRSAESLAVKVEQFRPNKNLIRFPHTYKIIKPFRLIITQKNGKLIHEVKYFKDEYPDFRRADEVESGLDENGWPLEVDPETGEVLLDRWWTELSQNKWHENVIKKKDNDKGSSMWNNKVVNGVKKRPAYKSKNTGHGYIRLVPEEYIGNTDALDKIMFIYNEWDSFRDDYRDGRYHLHSKTSMDYIIAGKRGKTPISKMRKIDTTNPNTRIEFVPLYYSDWDEDEDIRKRRKKEKNNDWWIRRSKLVQGRDRIRGDIRKEQLSRIPNDERDVIRIYNMNTELGTQYNMSRKPTPFDPAFDRAALESEFLHWGRMYYYETPDGINRWSENPFPHVSTRGIGKYLIDLTLRRTFGFEAARNVLRSNNQKWDYGIRHWGPPFITDPLGEAVPGPAGQGGQGPLAGAK